jgi:hypothetical protein
MAQKPELFRHTFNSAWLALATHEALYPPYLYDLSLEMAALVEETAPVVIVQASDGQEQTLAPLVAQLNDTLGSDRIHSQTLSDVDFSAHQGGIGCLVLQGGSPVDWVQDKPKFEWETSPSDSPLIDLVLLIGAPCAAVGEWMISAPNPEIVVPGLGWLPHGIVTPGLGHPADLAPVKDLLLDEPRSFAIGLPSGGILALGPTGELEIWSEVKPGILLGKGWGQT